MPADQLNKIVSTIIPDYIVTKLNAVLFQTPYIYINTWSLLHFAWGAAMPLIIGPNRPVFALIIHTIWEVIEYILSYGGHPLFVEEFVDIVWDTIVYMAGYSIIAFIYRKESKKPLRYTV